MGICVKLHQVQHDGRHTDTDPRVHARRSVGEDGQREQATQRAEDQPHVTHQCVPQVFAVLRRDVERGDGTEYAEDQCDELGQAQDGITVAAFREEVGGERGGDRVHARVEARHRRGEYAGDHQPGETGRHLVQNEVRENLIDLRKRFEVGRLLLVVDEQRRADPEK